jgi:toxin YoeB
MRNIVFEKRSFEEFTQWAVEDQKMYRKIVDLINDIQRTPFSGIGKPEPLKHELQGSWLR